jgi:2-dehydro-3-deoxyphosphogluconate aldolase/(4S)-4-hydroxy-2-oxoglutarate aldolase
VREDQMNFIEELYKRQLMVAVRTETPEQAYSAALACIEGGVKFIEITFSVPNAGEVIKKLSKDRRAAIGAGTVLNPGDVKKALRAGAQYIVSPNFDEEVVKLTKKEGAASVPGACTPTEIYRAYKAGGDVIKLFPFVEIGGLDFLKVIRGPFPNIKYMLCGGVKLDNISGYLSARAAGILVGSAILRRDLVESADWSSITEIAAKFVGKVEEFSGKE